MGVAPDRKNVTNRVVQTLLENSRQARTLTGILQLRVERIDVCGQPALAP